MITVISRINRRLCGIIPHSLFLFLSFSLLLFGQNYPPLPVPGGTMFRYNSDIITITSVSVAGPFNNWEKTANPFSYNRESKLWEGVVSLKSGTEHHYKFVINGTYWITDPSAPDVTEDEWRNGIIIPQEYGAPFIASQFPARNKRVEKIPSPQFVLTASQGDIDAASIKVLFNGKKISHRFLAKTSTLFVNLPGDLRDGEHTLLLSFADTKGNRNSGYETRFFLDRYIKEIKTPSFYDHAVMYEVFIRKFADGNGDGIGDFAGLTSRLGYINDTLGANVLWLMPFNTSPTEHGYSVIDYYSIEPTLGTLKEYFAFLKEAKRKGMRIIMDFVINHTDSAHPFFLDAYKNPKSKYSKWFQFINPEQSDWKHFGVERKMPKLEFNNKDVQEYFLKVASFWIDPNGDGDFTDGVDGFRCDAAKEVPHSYWNRFRKFVKKKRSDLYLLGEVWDNARYLIPFFKEEFDALFDYPHYYAFQELQRNGDIAAYQRRISELTELYPAGHQLVRFLSNHDNARPVNYAGSYEQFIHGLGLIFTLPGTPMVYYGDELAFTGNLPPENVRQMFDWELVKQSESTFLPLYKDLISIRKTHTALSARHDKKKKSLEFLENDENLLSFLRYEGKSVYIVIANMGDVALRDIEFQATNGIITQTTGNYTTLFGVKSGASQFGAVKLESFSFDGKTITLNNVYIEPGGFTILKLQ